MNLPLRPMRPDDLPILVRLTADTGFFRPEEVVVAEEVLADAAAKGAKSEYRTYVAANGGGVMGYVCFGSTPLTRGTWDIYWIAVDRSHQGQGIGKQLMQFAEGEILRHGGRLVLAETSSQDLYEPTRQFYLRLKYHEVSRIPDFYDVGDARVTFAKVLPSGGDAAMAI
ncbi:MAG: N-acetyltransferase [Dehalococcoidia bacterium]|nr:N-acetyltransferase [Dehalococcoidia bacterium]MSQ17443.1 N-acetyltransferase [Dehalococcoidia bacterium]